MFVQFFIQYSTKFSQKIQWIRRVENTLESTTVLDMEYVNSQWWKIEMDILEEVLEQFSYSYQVLDAQNNVVDVESVTERKLVAVEKLNTLMVFDTWFYSGAAEQLMGTQMFADIFYKPTKALKTVKNIKQASHLFTIKTVALDKKYKIGLLGSVDALGSWNEDKIIPLVYDNGYWQTSINLKNSHTPFAYKYVLLDAVSHKVIQYETGDNRLCIENAQKLELVILNDGYLRCSMNHFKGAGVAIPVFSLRSKKSFGIGEFNDLKLLIDWASKVGLNLIQLLPINDTIATFTKTDSYPYAAISAFALHPLYIHLDSVIKDEKIIQSFKRKKNTLNNLNQYDFEAVLKFKLSTLHENFELVGKELLNTESYKSFYTKNEYWLKPYAVFSYLRDKYNTTDFTKWKSNYPFKKTDVDRFFHISSASLKKVQFYCYLQFIAHIQLKEVVEYAHKKGIALKGDLPIGVSKYSSDTWMYSHLFNMDMQAGAPPDDFAVAGQNWGFPTYNWQTMKLDHYDWWCKRLQQMSQYFDAYRIDHILGFFRIWSIPQTATQGVLGKFVPAVPIHIFEFGEKSISFNEDRFCNPFITDEVLVHVFGISADYVKDHYLQSEKRESLYLFKNEYNTQRKVVAYFDELSKGDSNAKIKDGLLLLLANIILIKDDIEHYYHFRIDMDKTLSYRYLDAPTKEKLRELYLDYFYHRQEKTWSAEAQKKLPALKVASNMLICGEDLGMVPHCVPAVMKQLGLLSLEVQRMPKNSNQPFVLLDEVPYLSVVTPATHDMSTIRAWWEEDKHVTQSFYNDILGMSGAAPPSCESWIVRAIIMQHLYSPAMWSVFQIQDILGMNDALKLDNPLEERINIPANAHHYWGYRMHIYLEDLLKATDFNNELKDYIRNSGRCSS